jgi:hypothetical protein
VLIAVADDGLGMDDAVADDICNLFHITYLRPGSRWRSRKYR